MEELDYNSREWFESLAWQHRWIEYMAGWWVGHFGRPKTVIDFGCGDGWWLKCFHDMGSEVGGVELYEIAREFIPEQVHFSQLDLREPLYFPAPFDLVICLEVAEHLPQSAADTLCGTLARHTKEILLFSAAHPGQEGTGHLTLKPQSWWIDRLERHTLKFSTVKTAEVKIAFERIITDCFKFLPDNLMVFARI